MSRTLLLMMATILPTMSVSTPFSCERGAAVVRDGIYDFGPLLGKTPNIRVLLINDVKEAQLSINGCYQITGSLTNILDQGQDLPKSTISINNGRISVGDKQYDYSELHVVSLRDGEIKLNNLRYRGELRILQQFNNKFSVIQEVDIESFVAGVLGSEMPQTWNEDALRAQAVTARTYAMYKKKTRRDDVYHLDMLDLAYKGVESETPRLNKIIRETNGVVMVYNWNIFPAYFHSTCGGHTEDVRHVFGKDSIPPLSGVTCNYCRNTRYSSWSTDISKSDIERKLRNANMYVSNIQNVKAIYPGEGMHGSKVEIISANRKKEMNANDFRLLIGPNNLFSTAFNSINNGKSITFAGRGWGHGVGLCQYGAQGMAEKGFKWTAILKYYYPKVELVRIY